MTREIRKAAEALGIAIHDHLVIGRKGHASFRSLGCSSDPRFAMHCPGSRWLAAMDANAYSALASMASTVAIVTIDAIVDSATAPETDSSAFPERLANT
jgi:hypothetical protein